MQAAAPQQPIVPPRPERSADTPKVPPRPIPRAIERSLSPNKDRFAPSPLNETLSKSPGGTPSRVFSALAGEAALDHGTVELPSLGQEGLEYAAVEELSSARSQASSTRASSPEHTRTVGDLKLHAPKPSLPASSAKARVATVTHTDSEKAASFGIGIASSDDAQASKKKASTTSQDVSSDDLEEDEHGIPEIGLQVPMYPNAGDVQAPSPAQAGEISEPQAKKKSSGKASVRNFGELPPGSYGLHGHGILPSDKLEKVYYSKHPELAKLERTSHHSDRAKDFSKSSDELTRGVYESASASTLDVTSTPSEQVGWQAIEETVSRPASVAPKGKKSSSFGSQQSATGPEISVSQPTDEHTTAIFVDEPNRRRSVMFSDDEADFDPENEAPILAPDEVAKDPSVYYQEPAVEPVAYERRLSAYEEAGRPISRPTSRPTSVYKSKDETEEAVEEEYEPLFPTGDDHKTEKPGSLPKSATGEEIPGRFPSRDIWEDAPSSAYHTTEVSTPDIPAEDTTTPATAPAREGETPAQAFARRQEELAEKELRGADTFLENRKPHKQAAWPQAKGTGVDIATGAGTGTLTPTGSSSSSALRRPAMGSRFPSRDVWEDAPESLQLETTVSQPQEEEVPSPADASKPTIPKRPVRKLTDPEKTLPVPPNRPKPKIASTIEEPITEKHISVPDKPKPQVPARPLKHMQQPVVGKAPEVVHKPKPAVPARPVGGKIAQLQASFMSDLNKKLKIGPQAPKKEETVSTEETAPPAEKAPLLDARKGRARGPQRRAPAAVAAVAPAPTASAPVTLGFTRTLTLFSISPEDDVLSVPFSDSVSVAEIEAKTEETAEAKVVADAPVASDEKPTEKPTEKPEETPEEKLEETPEEKLEETPEEKLEEKAEDKEEAEEKVLEPAVEQTVEPIEPIELTAEPVASDAVDETAVEAGPKETTSAAAPVAAEVAAMAPKETV